MDRDHITANNVIFLKPHSLRSPDSFEHAKYFTSDFDGTKFITDEPAPSGMGVHEAYEQAFDEVGGPKAADIYRNHGHQGKTPAELVGVCMPDVEEIDLPSYAYRVTNIKLELLLDNIGTTLSDGFIWPRPTEGYLELWRNVYTARAAGLLIDTADISAGHDEFLRRTYQAHNIPEPDVLVTSDTVHQLSLTTRFVLSEYTKPAPSLMRIALDKWFELYNWANLDENKLSTYREKVFYVGDSLEKDGGLARNSGVDFIHVPKGGSAEAWQAVARRLALGNLATRGANAS